MSHFTVMVIGEDPEYQLAPFHEFECTGFDNEFVQDIDVTEKVRQEYQSAKTKVLRFPDGSTAEPYEDRFYREPTPEEREIIGRLAGSGCGGGITWISREWSDGKGYRAKIRFVPTEATEEEVLRSSTQSFAEYISDYYGYSAVTCDANMDLAGNHKYGYYRVDAAGNVIKVVDRTNPNKHWDWWRIGGLASNFLALKSGERASQARKRDIDFAAMQNSAEAEGLEDYRLFHKILAGREYPVWSEFRERHSDIGAARAEYRAHPVIKDFLELDTELRFRAGDNISQFLDDEATFRRRSRQQAIMTFAFVKDRQWHQRGSMGWFAFVCDEKKPGDWASEFYGMLESLAPNDLITIVDCHT